MQLDAGTRDLLRQELRQELRAEMRAELREEIRQEIIEAEVKARVAAEFESRIEAEVRDRVEAEVLKRLRVYIKEMEMARRRQFGRSTETSSAQYRLFDEADELAGNSSEADDQAELPEENTHTTQAGKTPWQAPAAAGGSAACGDRVCNARGRAHLPLRLHHGGNR